MYKPRPIFIFRLAAGYRSGLLPFIILILIGCRTDDRSRTWSIYKADNESSSYSGLTMINNRNVHQLATAWTFSFKDEFNASRLGAVNAIP